MSLARCTVLALPFALLCTLNSAGYRYGASDQAFYIPAVLLQANPRLFPRDAALIASQAKLTVVDEGVAAVVRATAIPLPVLFFVLYLATLVLLACAAAWIGAQMYRSPWTIAALLAALTLRHAISQTGTNTLEGYFHPRQLAFALGLTAVGAFVHRRDAVAAALIVLAAVIHSTTALWFAVWLGVAMAMSRREWPPLRNVPAIAVVLLGAAVAAVWALVWGPFAGRLVRMDPAWLAVIADKNYLFPLAWHAGAWLTNLVTIPVILIGWRWRERAGLAHPRERALVLGAMSLVLVFICWLPFDAARLALAVQVQAARLFWPLDILATIYLVWMLAEGATLVPARARLAAAVIAALSLARGTYICFVEFPDRPVVAMELSNGDWRTAMEWARQTPTDTEWLADPMHAVKYGSSVRVAAARDVLLENVKDGAIAMYDRGIAMRVADRRRALAGVAWNTADGALALARRYDLDYLVTDRTIDLPVAFRAGTLTIYRLR